MAVKVQRRYPLHWVFFAYTLVTLLLAVGAFNANNNLLFWLFGLSLGLLITSGFLSGTMMMALRVQRLGVLATAQGEALVVRYRVTNASRWMPIFAVVISEHLVDEPGAEVNGPAPGGALANPTAGAQQGRVDRAPVAHLAHLPPRASMIVEGLAQCVARGRVSSAGYEALTTFPFGLIKKSLWHGAPTRVVIPPRRERVDEQLLDGRAGRAMGGPSERTVTRAGDELVGLRPYAQGDAQRLVAWRASSRQPTGELVVKQTATGSPRRVRVALTLRAAAGAGASETAIARAAALVRIAHERRMLVGLSVWTDFGYILDAPPGSVPGGATALINELGLLRLPAPPAGAGQPPPNQNLATGLGLAHVPARGRGGDIVLCVGPLGEVGSPGATGRSSGGAQAVAAMATPATSARGTGARGTGARGTGARTTGAHRTGARP